MDKEETFFFLKTAHWYSLNFLVHYFLIRPENVLKGLKIYRQNF